MNPIISLVSGTYNRIAMLKEMIQSFRDNLLPGLAYEIVLVDGGSTDGTIEWAKSQSDIVLIEDGALLGAISAFTRGAFTARGKFVLLANDDILFKPNSIIPAIIHLENNLRCGAVAYADNRPIPDHFTREDYKTLRMGATRNGARTSVVYAQVGLFRNWLGRRLNWWTGEHNEMMHASTYAGDNSLSAQIWHYGYSVDPVPQCIVEDHVANDELRQINYQKGLKANDSHWFYDQWPPFGEVVVMDEPQIPQQHKRAARILYLPIYEPGWAVQKHPIHGKNGLRNALARGKNKHGEQHIVQEFDYLSVPENQLREQLFNVIDSFQPDLILTQLQSWRPITAALLREIRNRSAATIINWNGDQAPGGLAAPEMIEILHQVDLQLITNLDVTPIYDQQHIKWAYWQIGYEEPPGDLWTNVQHYFQELGRPNPFQVDDRYPVVYLASLRTPQRLAIADLVTQFGGRVFTPGDPYATLYNFSTSTFAYRQAKVIISDNGFTSRGFVSNRLFQALASGGGVVLQQHVEGLDELTGLAHDVHYLEWNTIEDLRQLITRIFSTEYDGWSVPEQIAKNGTIFVRTNYSFDAQVAKLMQIIQEKLGSGEEVKTAIALRYVGHNPGGFGLGNAFPSQMRYEYQPGRLLMVRPEDAPEIFRMYPNQWEIMNTE